MGEAQELRALHDAYVWDINAAIGEDRLDLVWQLADDYVDEALRMITAGAPYGCGREGCPACGRVLRHRVRPQHWWQRRRPA